MENDQVQAKQTSTVSIGDKLRHFRQAAGLSQLQLESLIGAAPGSVSRMESGKVNPTKETLEQMSSALQLNYSEKAYLYGVVSPFVTGKEVAEAISAIEEYFEDESVFAYLLDDRHRMHYVSKGFLKLFNIDKGFIEEHAGTSILQVALDPDLPVYEKIDRTNYHEFIRIQTARHLSDFKLFGHEEWYVKLLNKLRTFPEFKGVYTELSANPNLYVGEEARTVYFNLNGLKVKTVYTREPLREYPRFEVLEYVVANPLVRTLAKVLK